MIIENMIKDGYVCDDNFQPYYHHNNSKTNSNVDQIDSTDENMSSCKITVHRVIVIVLMMIAMVITIILIFVIII